VCGICGYTFFDRERSVDQADLQRMNDAIIHRGPNDEGYFLDANIGLAMRRLSIIDLAGGRQPIYNEDQTVVTVFNGEIYNYLELKKDLETRGHRFRTNCDTEVLVHLYEEYGADLMAKLNGMFVFAIFDKRERRLLIARDRLGVKPLYYTAKEGRFIFGSEVKSIIAVGACSSELDTEALHHYLTFRFVPSPMTMWKDVRKLPPGCCIECHDGNFSVRRYWDISFVPHTNTRSCAQAAEEVHDLVVDSVKRRLMAEVPLGSMLSGGVDSAVVTAAMAQTAPGRVSTFTIDYAEEGPHREAAYARIVSEAFNTDHHEIVVGATEFMEALDRMVYFMDEPIADPAAIPVWELCRFSKQHVTVLLSGIGGDEVFGGYPIYREALYRKQLRLLPPALWRGVVAPLYPAWLPGRNFVKRIGFPLGATFLGSSPIYGGFSEAQKQSLYTSDYGGSRNDSNSHDFIAGIVAHLRGVNDLDAMMYIDTRLWLADSHLIMSDKMSMAVSLEIREPLLDYRIVELAATMPAHFKRTLRESKVVLKSAFAKTIPAAIIHRKKRGFSTPLDVWMKQSRPEVESMLTGPAARIMEYVRPQPIHELFDRHARGEGDQSASLFTLIVLELWLRRFCGTASRPNIVNS
jgi:asparagine synthase (glutamine-hydrolysing)